MIEIKTDADAKKLVGELVYYPGCGLLVVGEAKLADGKLYITPERGATYSRVDKPGDLRVLTTAKINFAPPPPPKVRREFSGLIPMDVTFHDGGCQVQWGTQRKESPFSSAWLALVYELLGEYAEKFNLCFPKDTEVKIQIAGKITIVRLERDV